MEGGWMRGTEQKIATLMRKLKSAVVKKNMNANKMEIFHRQNKLLDGKKPCRQDLSSTIPSIKTRFHTSTVDQDQL